MKTLKKLIKNTTKKLKKLFTRDKPKKPKMKSIKSHYYGRMFPPIMTKQYKPPFPSTFVFEDYVYDQWNQDLIEDRKSTRLNSSH